MPEAPESTVWLALPGLALEVGLPKGASQSRPSLGTLELDLAPDTRRLQRVNFGGAAPDLETDDVQARTLACGATLRWTERRSDAGNGGTMAEIRGELSMDAGRVAVACVTEAEEAPSLGWCLELLEGLRRAQSKP